MKTIIKYKRTVKNPWQRLPFVSSNPRAKAPNWNVPAKGGYFGGFKTGQFMAVALLKYQRQDDDAGFLEKVVESFMRRYEMEGGSAMLDKPPSEWSEGFKALRGQYYGFFSYLGKWLHYASTDGDNLDNTSEKDIETGANAGLAYNEKAVMAAICSGKFQEEDE
ncbi:hypothetical protein F6R98_06505 [Candidatus Methylospira mobilis]|uniref:Uncharacterized protein n=1 Tax=Candidatus Methylospira mobilis TaxID=1808979 RepID=A0A5Q0BJD0_9GAMM|nr:hypothetical protein [Candidatus Methylospira mobilis]QFY42321.1 hypothetical protein F6R98_06505 [Candidatus Methylospira mobilis]